MPRHKDQGAIPCEPDILRAVSPALNSAGRRSANLCKADGGRRSAPSGTRTSVRRNPGRSKASRPVAGGGRKVARWARCRDTSLQSMTRSMPNEEEQYRAEPRSRGRPGPHVAEVRGGAFSAQGFWASSFLGRHPRL